MSKTANKMLSRTWASCPIFCIKAAKNQPSHPSRLAQRYA